MIGCSGAPVLDLDQRKARLDLERAHDLAGLGVLQRRAIGLGHDVEW